MEKMKYSIILPFYNEEQSLEPLTSRITKTFGDLKQDYEIIFMNDGSTDNSLEIVREMCKKNKNLKCISFRANSGKAMVLSCGFNFVEGDIIFTMDSDLQDQPEEIPKFIEKINEGYDLVSGWKKKRFDPPDKVIASRIFNFFTSRLTGVKIHDFNCGFKAYRKEVVKTLDIYGDLFRFIPALVKWNGFKVGEVVITHAPRKYSKSKYGQRRLFRGFMDLFTIMFLLRYLKRPLHFFGIIGTIIFIIGVIINIYLSVIWTMGQQIGDRPLLILGTLMVITGLQFISTGLLGEMIAHFESKVDKNYPISEKIGIFEKN
jgi:glycosyltransferase involved in cell wall biosynthesis